MKRLKWGSLLGLVAMLGAMPVLAQSANFGTLTLDAGKTAGTLSGTTGGSTSLPAIVSSSDRNNNKCLGFADPNPDHLLILKQDVASLKLRVKSDGADTTLVVQGTDSIRCGDDTGANKDASITDTNWKAGTYKIWVGSATPGVRKDYSLSVRQ
jgi:hypothetical protein